MNKTAFILLAVALVVIPLVSAQTPQDIAAPQPVLAPELAADPSLLTEPLHVALGGGRYAAYIPVAADLNGHDFTASGDTWAGASSP